MIHMKGVNLNIATTTQNFRKKIIAAQIAIDEKSNILFFEKFNPLFWLSIEVAKNTKKDERKYLIVHEKNQVKHASIINANHISPHNAAILSTFRCLYDILSLLFTSEFVLSQIISFQGDFANYRIMITKLSFDDSSFRNL